MTTVDAITRESRPGTWQAFITLDGQPIDRSCMHNHKSERLATSCVGNLRAHHIHYFSNLVSHTEIEPGLWEVHTTSDRWLNRPIMFRYRKVEA